MTNTGLFTEDGIKVLGIIEAEKVSIKKGRDYDQLPLSEQDMVLMLDRLHEKIFREVLLENKLIKTF